MRIIKNTKGFMILIMLISVLISIFACANDYRSNRRRSGDSTGSTIVRTQRDATESEYGSDPVNEATIEHTFTGAFEGEGFRISVLEGWSENRTGELVPESSAGMLTLTTKSDVEFEKDIDQDLDDVEIMVSTLEID